MRSSPLNFLSAPPLKKKRVTDQAIDRRLRTGSWLVFAVLAVATGYTVFEAISPTGILSRALISSAHRRRRVPESPRMPRGQTDPARRSPSQRRTPRAAGARTGGSPDVLVLGGPNAAGKSTAAPRSLRGPFEGRRIRQRGHAGSRPVGVSPTRCRRRGRPHGASTALRVGGAAEEFRVRVDTRQSRSGSPACPAQVGWD